MNYFFTNDNECFIMYNLHYKCECLHLNVDKTNIMIFPKTKLVKFV